MISNHDNDQINKLINEAQPLLHKYDAPIVLHALTCIIVSNMIVAKVEKNAWLKELSQAWDFYIKEINDNQ